jgi:enterochelin esterase family protein
MPKFSTVPRLPIFSAPMLKCISLSCAALLSISCFTALAADTEPAKTTPAPETAAKPANENEFVIGPTYVDAPEFKVREDVPKGKIFKFTMNSTDSKFYPGIKRNVAGVSPYTRNVTVYVPSQYVAGTPAPFIISQDASGANNMPIALDNMIHDHRLPAMVAIFIMSGGGDSKGSERGLEYDTVSAKYAEFVEAEVLPRVSRECEVVLTSDPDARATTGGSSGGVAAFTMAWFRPDLYHRVLTYSGTYVDQQSPFNPISPQGAWGYHQYWIGASPKKPLRIWLEVSENDNGAKAPEAGLHNWVMANERMAAVLKAKNYDYRYVFAKAAGHTDGRVFRQTLPEALEWLWKGYTPKETPKEPAK